MWAPTQLAAFNRLYYSICPHSSLYFIVFALYPIPLSSEHMGALNDEIIAFVHMLLSF